VSADRAVALPRHAAPWPIRLLRGLTTPGGAVFLLALVLLVAVILVNPNLGQPEPLIRFAGRTAPFAIAAIGQFMVILAGEFDLSMAAVITTQVVIAGNVIGQQEERVLPGIALMLAVGVVIGLVNGLATTLLKVPSFIVTLGTMLALGGYVRFLTGGAATGNPVDSFRAIGRGGIEGIPLLGFLPYSVLLLIAVCVGAVLLMRSPFGRTLQAVGDNPVAAEYAGARMWWVRTRAFGYAGVHPSVGQGYEFLAITAVVLGGVVLGGGRGWVLSAAAGAFALELLFMLLNTAGVESTWRPTVQGVIIIAAVALAARTWRVRRRTAARPVATDADPQSPETAPDVVGEAQTPGPGHS
jgi:ribose transport system permease protein